MRNVLKLRASVAPDEALKALRFWIELLIDEEPPVNFERYAIDLQALVSARHASNIMRSQLIFQN